MNLGITRDFHFWEIGMENWFVKFELHVLHSIRNKVSEGFKSANRMHLSWG